MEKEGSIDKKVLYVGLDDSNHSGDRKGDIIAATFSFDLEDSIVRKFPNREDYYSLRIWLGEPHNSRDYRFAILLDQELRRFQPNIPLVAPYLINSFLESYPCKPENLKVYVDGLLHQEHKAYLRNIFKPRFLGFVVDNFIKKKNVPVCPKVVYMAHVLASDLYTGPFPSIIEHPKRIEVQEKILVETLHSLR